MAAFEDSLYQCYSASAWGLKQFAPLSDVEQRAIASDVVLSAVEGIKVNLREFALGVLDVQDLVGPNGRTMDGPDTTVDDVLNRKRLHRAITDALRAFGSALDCLAAAAIGVLGLATSLHAASVATLLKLPKLPAGSTAGQAAARAATAECCRRHANASPPGWLAWALELRNAVVHRGHLSETWLPVPSGRSRSYVIRSDSPPHLLIRFEPHLRGRPWQPDMLTLTGTGTAGDQLVWLPEPATATLTELKTRIVPAVDEISTLLRAALFSDDRDAWVLPEQAWRFDRKPSRPRIVEAGAFEGFLPSYPVPRVDQFVVHPRSAQRLELAERVRVHGQAG